MQQNAMILAFVLAMLYYYRNRSSRFSHRRRFSLLDNIPDRIRIMSSLVQISDEECKNILRMDRLAFSRLCDLLQILGGLTNFRFVTIQEKVAIFLSILAHHSKNRFVKNYFKRSGQTVSKHFHTVLRAVLKLHSLFLVQPVAVADDSTDPRRENFKVIHLLNIRF